MLHHARLVFEAAHCGVMLTAVTLMVIYLFILTPRIRFATEWVDGHTSNLTAAWSSSFPR
jgi:hypothetical protein